MSIHKPNLKCRATSTWENQCVLVEGYLIFIVMNVTTVANSCGDNFKLLDIKLTIPIKKLNFCPGSRPSCKCPNLEMSFS